MTDPAEDADAPDADVWLRIRDDPDAFGSLFERYGERIHGYALRRTGDLTAAEDVTAIVFLEAWRRRHEVVLHQPSALPWLYGVAANVLRGQRRTRRRHQAALERLGHLQPPTPEPEPEPEAVAGRSEALEAARNVMDAISRLPRREHDVLVLSVWEGLSHDEIAAALEIPVGTVKSRLARARARLEPHRRGAPGVRSELTLKEGMP
jgi:RNA polymerase sigma-70 factor (ECF subfamily)